MQVVRDFMHEFQLLGQDLCVLVRALRWADVQACKPVSSVVSEEGAFRPQRIQLWDAQGQWPCSIMLLFHLNNVKWKRTWMVLCKGVCKWNQPALTSFGLEVTVRCSWLINRSKDHQSFQHCVWLPKHSWSNRRPTTIFCHVRTADLQQWRETGGEREWWMHTIDNFLAPLVYSQNQYIKCPHFRWLDTISPNGLHLGCWCQVRVPAEWPSRVGKNQNEESMRKVSTCVPLNFLTSSL